MSMWGISFALSWFSMEQVVDLKAEGLWDELLDEFQPAIVIHDWWVYKLLLIHTIYALYI